MVKSTPSRHLNVKEVLFILFCFFSIVLCFSFKPQKIKTTVNVELHISPIFKNGAMSGLEISYQIPNEILNDQNDFSLFFDLLEPSLKRGRDTVNNLIVNDRKGLLSFTNSDKQILDNSKFQIWKPMRNILGPITVKYDIAAANPNPEIRGPHVDMQRSGNGLSGSFNGILLFPKIEGNIALYLKWELGDGYTAVTTYGQGNCTSLTNYTDFMDAQFMVGKMAFYPSPPPVSGFSVYALGLDSIKLALGAIWPEQTYKALRTRLNGSKDKSFRFFIRSYIGGPLSSGRASEGSFLLYLAPEDSLNKPDIRSLIAHEMVHVLVPGLSFNSDADDWYVEGIAEYLSFIIPYNAHLYSKEFFLQLLNKESAEYYTNSLRLIPNALVPDVMWAGRNAWTVPYSRGMLYFADLDSKLNRIKKPHETVISLILKMNSKILKEKSLTSSTWVKLLHKNVGEWAVDDWKKMNSGKLILFKKNSVLSGFIAKRVKVGFFDLGFALPKNLQKGIKITGLIPNSSAARAGIHNGDEIAEPINLLPVYSSFDSSITIKVERDGKLMSFTYLPRTGSHMGIKWVSANN
jgi:hypothetical protein